MDVLLTIGLLIIGCLLNLIFKPKEKFVYNIALAYLFLSLLLGITTWAFVSAIIKVPLILKIFGLLLQWGGLFWYFVLGYLMFNIYNAIRAINNSRDHNQLKRIIRATLWAVTILTGNFFILSSIGKAENHAQMVIFFAASGYAVWFLYFIIAAEGLGSLGILLHFKLKTGPFAAVGLMMIMTGAVYTHLHRKDPFSDAYAAIIQFITLSLMLVIYYFETRVNMKQSGLG